MRVIINGNESSINAMGLPKIADVVELIKASIDPAHMITELLLDGKELADNDWAAPCGSYETAIIEVATNTPDAFVQDRMAKSSTVVQQCFMQFRDSRKSFQSGDMQRGNQQLIRAVDTTRAFFEWYGVLLELVPTEQRPAYDISAQVSEISSICKRICQQQLYQSWWALGETIEKELEPKLDKLEDFCRKFERQV
jgi:hypothetical protein